MSRKRIVAAGVFLVVLGFVFLGVGIWYAYMYGLPSEISARDLLMPEFSNDVLWLMSVSCAMVVLGLLFLWSARRMPQK